MNRNGDSIHEESGRPRSATEVALLARIAELEDEVRGLKAELAARDEAATLGARTVSATAADLITADGTRGMERGVSRGAAGTGHRGEADR